MEEKMGSMPIKKLLLTMSLPIMLSMLIQALYNIVDSMFVAQYSQEALAAVSLSFPVQMLIIAVSVGTAIGVNSLLSRRLGQKRMDEANETANHGIFLALCSWLVFAIFGLFFANQFAALFTTDLLIVSQAATYIQICTIFCFGVFVQIIMERITQATGFAVYNMVIQGVGAVINIILDPIFIFGWFGFPEMGVAGAAIATVIGQICAMLLGFWLIHKKVPQIHLGFRHFRLNGLVIRDIYAVGFPAIIMQSVMSIMTIGMNVILMPYSAIAISVYSIYAKLQQFIFMPIAGLNSALIGIVGYNFGAKNKKRILDSIRYSLIASAIIMLVGTILFQLFPNYLLFLFNAKEEMLHLGVPALKIISLSFLFAGISMVLCSVFQALGEGLVSLWITLGRQLIITLPLAWILSQLGGIEALWYSFLIAEAICAIISYVVLRQVERRQITKLEEK